MKIRSLALAAFVLASAPPLAAGEAWSPAAPKGLAATVAELESLYRGDVVGVRYDAADETPAHYHVDVLYPGPVLLAVEVDATTLDVVRTREAARANDSRTLADAAAFAASNLGGEVTAIALDPGAGRSAHYDVDVRVADGRTARLTVDPATRQIAWRSPPVGFR